MGIELGSIQETLLIPLYYRATESRREHRLFYDQAAVEILPELDYDFSNFDAAWSLRNDVVVRTVMFDELVTDFMERYPDGRVINLGAGLDARFQRLDNGRIRWYDLDVPDSIELRRRFLTPTDRNVFISKSMFDTSWFDDVGADAPTLIVAEALFFYFDEASMKDLLLKMLQRFPRAELVFQSVCPGIVGRKKSVPILRRTRAELLWGIHSGRELSSWDPNFQFISEWSLVDRFVERWRWYRLVKVLPHYGRFLREVMKITHIRFAVDGA